MAEQITNDVFENILGRAATPEELQALNAQWSSFAKTGETRKVTQDHFHSQDQVVKSYKSLLDDAKSYARNIGTAIGVDLTTEQLDQLARSYVTPSDIAAGWSLASGANRENFLDQKKDFIQGNVVRFQQENYRNPSITPDYLDQASGLIKRIFNRDVDPEEAKYFAQELARGKSPYELSQELQSLPEYQRMQASKDRESLNVELLKQQQEVFQKALPNIISSFQRAGRLNSSGLQNALAQAQAGLDRERQMYLAQVGQQDVTGIRANAFQDYLRRDQPYQQARDIYGPASQFNIGLGFMQQGTARQREIADYQRQQSDYNRYFQGGGNNGFAGFLQGALSGAATGGMAGGPWGAMAGGLAGGFGGYYGTRR